MDLERIQEILAQVAEIDAAERGPFLDKACGDDAELRREIERLLESLDSAGDFLDAPVVRIGTEVLPEGWEAPFAEIGKHVGPYKLVEVVGQGGMGVVYLAERGDESYERQVAVKLILRGVERGAALHRFRREIQTLAGLEHPNIARMYDGGEIDDGRPYLVMEYVEGLALDKYCREHNLGIEERIQLFQQVCAAVSYAHQNLLVHRDLKPSNILVTAEGVPKLLDFGIAMSLAEDKPRSTLPGERPMTPAYASPEQVRGLAITTASDVYSLGVLLYELLAGALPYRLSDESDLTLQVAIRDQDPARPSSAVQAGKEGDALRRRLRGDLDYITLKALRKEPELRYVSVQALSEDLGRFLDHLPVLAREGAFGYRVRKFIRRNRVGVGVAAAVVITLTGFVLALIRQSQIATTERDRAERERDRSAQALTVMINAFKASDPEQARGQEITARQILDEGAAKVRQDLAGEKDLQATLLGAMGEVYVSLGLFDEAAALHLEALKLRRQVDVDVGVSLYQLGELEWGRRDYAAAERSYRQALGYFEPGTVQHAQAMRGVGLTLVWQGQHGEAAAALRHALDVLVGRFDADDEEILRIKFGLGRSSRDQAEYDSAEALLRDVVSARRPGGKGPALGRSLAELGEVRFQQGELQEARLLLEEAIPMLRMGGETTYVGEALGKLTPILMRLGDDVGAERVAREILTILPEGHPGTVMAYHNLGMMLGGRGDLDEAETFTMEALRLKRAKSDESSSIALSLCLLGGIAFERPDLLKARARYEECATMMEAVHPPNHPQVGFALWGLGRSVEALDGCEAAEVWWRRGYEVRREGLGEEHYLTAMTAGRLGACLGELGGDSEAERLLVESLEVLGNQLKAGHPRVCDAAERLRAFYRERGNEEKLHAVAVSSCG